MCASQWWEKYWDSLLEKKNSSRFKHPVDTDVVTLERQPCLNFWPPGECRYDKHSTFNFDVVVTDFSRKYVALKSQNAPLCSPACCSLCLSVCAQAVVYTEFIRGCLRCSDTTLTREVRFDQTRDKFLGQVIILFEWVCNVPFTLHVVICSIVIIIYLCEICAKWVQP